MQQLESSPSAGSTDGARGESTTTSSDDSTLTTLSLDKITFEGFAPPKPVETHHTYFVGAAYEDDIALPELPAPESRDDSGTETSAPADSNDRVYECLDCGEIFDAYPNTCVCGGRSFSTRGGEEADGDGRSTPLLQQVARITAPLNPLVPR